MSLERARNALRGEPTDCIPLLDMPSHAGFLRKLTGIDPFADTVSSAVAAIKKLDVDLLAFGLPGQTQASEDDPNLVGLGATTWRHKGHGRTDIFDYDPQRDRGELEGMGAETLAGLFRQRIAHENELVGDTALSMGFTFTTCIHYAAEDLDWEEFIVACLTEPDRVDELLDRFQAASEKVFQAYADAGVEVMCSHDDIAMSTGTVQSPDWLREHVIGRYPEIWKPIKDRGIPLLFMTDGNFHAVAEDLQAAGADGFFLDVPCADLARLVEQCGTDMVYYTGPTPATMTVGDPSDVRDEVRKLADIAADLPRFFFHMPGGYTRNMPTENVQAFYDTCREIGRR